MQFKRQTDPFLFEFRIASGQAYAVTSKNVNQSLPRFLSPTLPADAKFIMLIYIVLQKRTSKIWKSFEGVQTPVQAPSSLVAVPVTVLHIL